MGAAARFHTHQDGQAIYIVVIYMFLLLGLLVLVISSGEKLNHKIQMQGAADSAAMTGGAWYARGLNVAAMCDVGELQMLSTIVLCDTLETVTPPAKECIDKLGKDVEIDLRLTDRYASSANHHLFLVAGNAAAERQVIHQFADIVQAIQWPKYLDYNGGVLWDCMKLLDGFSHAMILDTPRAASREASDIAKQNHAEFGFMTPFWPALPVEIGTFQDFKDPMRLGQMPQRFLGRPGYPTQASLRIGGFRWGTMNYVCYGSTYLDDSSNTLRYLSGAKGPWSYWREPFVEARPMGLLDLSGFGVLFNVVSSMKFEMLFGSAEDQASLRNWEYDYDTAKGKSRDEIQRTWWEDVSFDARYVEDEEREPFPPPSAGDWTAKKWGINKDQLHANTRMYRGEGRNPWPSMTGYTRATQGYEGADPRRSVWYRVDHRRHYHYPQLGIFAPHPPQRPDGSPWPYAANEYKTYYRISMRRFNGAELTPDTTLHRNYMPALGEDPDIAPVFFTENGENLVDNIEKYFTFNGYAYRSAKATSWVQRFINPNPVEGQDGAPALVCYAQARVYNPASWDLFTQAWKVKLMRAEASYSESNRWGEMLGELNKGIPSQAAQAVEDLTPERVKPVIDTVRAYTPDFVKEVTH
jgi:hypothetical protein